MTDRHQFAGEGGYRWDRLGSLPRKRYVHHLTHEGEGYELAVGCVCAEHLTKDYAGPRMHERMLKNRVARLRRLLDLEKWKATRNGNRRIRYRKARLVLYVSPFTGAWRINVGEVMGRKDHASPEAAIVAAFEYLDPPKYAVARIAGSAS